MASILDKYGIKEVADVTFYEINDNGGADIPVLYLDTLKVSTIEQTSETAEARGGKGNAALISWDYGKEINVTLEDALFSVKSMAIMYGDNLDKIENKDDGDSINIKKTVIYVPSETTSTKPTFWTDPADGKIYATSSTSNAYVDDAKFTFYDEKGNLAFVSSDGSDSGKLEKDNRYYLTIEFTPDSFHQIEISANKFPGTYYITGDTYARSEKTGKDEFFQFIIPKAKVLSENTLTLEAEGDPSVFNMNLKVLRPEDGVMMKLVKYSLDNTSSK